MVHSHIPNPPIAALDFEASSLEETGFPIEVAFALGDRTGVTAQFSTLIKPRPHWKGAKAWSGASQRIHGISSSELEGGMDADTVCYIMDAALEGLEVMVDGGSFDTFWLQRLYDGRQPKFSLDHLTQIDPARFLALKQATEPTHRALPDALWLLRTTTSIIST